MESWTTLWRDGSLRVVGVVALVGFETYTSVGRAIGVVYMGESGASSGG